MRLPLRILNTRLFVTSLTTKGTTILATPAAPSPQPPTKVERRIFVTPGPSPTRRDRPGLVPRRRAPPRLSSADHKVLRAPGLSSRVPSTALLVLRANINCARGPRSQRLRRSMLRAALRRRHLPRALLALSWTVGACSSASAAAASRSPAAGPCSPRTARRLSWRARPGRPESASWSG